MLAYWATKSAVTDLEWSTVANSLLGAALAAGVGAAAALPVALLAARHPSRPTTIIERLSYAGHALPGIVVALALVFLGTRVSADTYQTLAMLVLAYVILFLPQAIVSIRASLLQIDPHVEEAARSLGRSPLAVLRTITAPLARSGVLARGGARLPHRRQGATGDAPAGADRLRHARHGDLAAHVVGFSSAARYRRRGLRVTPGRGTVEVGDRTVAARGVNVPPEKRRVGMVFQEYALFPHLSVEQNVAYGLANSKARKGPSKRCSP